MRLMAGVARCLFICTVLLLLPAIATAQSCTYLYTTTSAPSPFPDGFGVPWNVFNPTQLPLKASCTTSSSSSVKNAEVGPGSNTLIIYTQGYQWNAVKNQWDSFTYHCDAALIYDVWCPGNATAVLTSSSPAYLAYTCNRTGTQWKCGCRDQACTQNHWQLQRIQPVSRTPQGKAPNLVVLVHGCCTDKNGVKEWDGLGGEITQKILRSNTSDKWEVVVWDWSEDTPGIIDFSGAYEKAVDQGHDLATAILSISQTYKYIHLIGHSAGSRLIQQAAKELANNYRNQQNKPFIHLTFLDAFTPTPPLGDYQDSGENAYGFLEGIPHYSEQYVNRPTPEGPDFPFTDTCLNNAFNFNITGWENNDKSQEGPKSGHFWPVRWYKQSVTGSGFKYGFPLSFEGGVQTYTSLFIDYPNGFQCGLTDVNTTCKTGVSVLTDPAYRCWE